MPDELDEQFDVAVVDFAAPGAAKRFTDSLKTTGFAVLTNHPIANDLITGVYSEWRDFLSRLHRDAVRGETKSGESLQAEDGNLAARYLRDPITQTGYFPMSSAERAKGATAQDLKHYYQLYFPHGQYPDEVTDDARRLWTELLALGKTLVGWIDDHMPPDVRATIQEKIGEGVTLSDCVSDERTMLRVLHYPGQPESARPAGAVRAAAHEDINLITVLPAGSARGLQVRSNQAGAWREVPPVPGSIVINVGDMLQEMSGRAYVSTTHRVVELADDGGGAAAGDGGAREDGDQFALGDRMSTPCFVHLKEKCPVSSRYGSAQHYLLERLVTLGVVPPDTVEEFLKEYPKGVTPGWNPKEE